MTGIQPAEVPNSTPEKTRYGFGGDKLYQRRARRALPILVRQANARRRIEYGALAAELGMENPRNLNYPLGAIGNELLRLGETWQKKIPPIEVLVISRSSRLPGELVGPGEAEYEDASMAGKRAIVAPLWEEVYSFGRWEDVLSHFGLDPAAAPTLATGRGLSLRSEGESREHKALKSFVADHPVTIGAPDSTAPGETEFLFRSGDRADVLFRASREWTVAEVKSEISTPSDIERGLFQCVKYKALLEATLHAEQRCVSARTVLVLANPLPNELIPLRNTLGLEVVIVDRGAA